MARVREMASVRAMVRARARPMQSNETLLVRL